MNRVPRSPRGDPERDALRAYVMELDAAVTESWKLWEELDNQISEAKPTRPSRARRVFIRLAALSLLITASVIAGYFSAPIFW